MTARQEQSHQLQQPEADSAIQREADRVVPENTGQPVGRVDYPDVFEQVWREYPLRAGANPKKFPVSGTNNQRCVNHISEPDTEIPPGFRG
ncbi:hypothetical protein J6939_004912 [Escherichia coli]|nr:hypothetical protein [Escherichia coli]